MQTFNKKIEEKLMDIEKKPDDYRKIYEVVKKHQTLITKNTINNSN